MTKLALPTAPAADPWAALRAAVPAQRRPEPADAPGAPAAAVPAELPDALAAELAARHDAAQEWPDGSWGDLLDAPPLEESDGVEALRRLAASIATQLVVDKVWAGKADGVRVRTGCPACGCRQVVRVPFLEHDCASCGASWGPERCRTCSRTIVVATTGELAPVPSACPCGGELEKVRLVPRQRTTADELPSADAAGDRLAVTSARRARPWVGGALAAAALALGAAVLVLPARSAPAPAAPAAAARPAAAPGSPAARGAAAAHRIVSSGRPVSALTCRAEYAVGAPAIGPTDPGFLSACLRG